MIQTWSIRNRAIQCAQSGRPFCEGEAFHTAIYFDEATGDYLRRDVALDAWEQELQQRRPLAYWRSQFSPQIVEAKPEVTSKESAMSLLSRFTQEDESHTENARYILALMLERKRILTPTATKEIEGRKMLFYENRKTGEVFVIRDPELRLDELEDLQEEVAMLLGFHAPTAPQAQPPAQEAAPETQEQRPSPESGNEAQGGDEAQATSPVDPAADPEP